MENSRQGAVVKGKGKNFSSEVLTEDRVICMMRRYGDPVPVSRSAPGRTFSRRGYGIMTRKEGRLWYLINWSVRIKRG
jgi:hypothetical protein